MIPADRKWFERIGAAAVLVHALMEIDPRFPTVTKAQRKALLEAKRALEAQAPKGAAADPFEQGRRHTVADEAERSDSHPAPGATMGKLVARRESPSSGGG